MWKECLRNRHVFVFNVLFLYGGIAVYRWLEIFRVWEYLCVCMHVWAHTHTEACSHIIYSQQGAPSEREHTIPISDNENCVRVSVSSSGGLRLRVHINLSCWPFENVPLKVIRAEGSNNMFSEIWPPTGICLHNSLDFHPEVQTQCTEEPWSPQLSIPRGFTMTQTVILKTLLWNALINNSQADQ